LLASISADAATRAETDEPDALPAIEGFAVKQEAVNSGFGDPGDEVDSSAAGSP
jgi:hypothetical protein